MSYDLNFWKYKEGVYLNNQKVYERNRDEEYPTEGLEKIPIEKIIEEIANAFTHWNRSSGNDWENEKGKGAFQLYTNPQFVRIDCYGMEGDDMNTFIDILDKYDCPLYDPQVPQRYDDK